MIKALRGVDKEKIYCLYYLTSKDCNNLYMAKCWIRLNWIVKQKKLLKNECSVEVFMGGRRRQVKIVKMPTGN